MTKRAKRLAMIAAGLWLGLHFFGPTRLGRPYNRVKVPSTRYHGYELNQRSIEKAKKFTVLISNEGWDGGMRGTGIIYDSHHIITCNHMARAFEDDKSVFADEYWIFTSSGPTVLHGKSVFENKKNDLMIIELDKEVKDVEFATFQKSWYLGEPITIIGNTLGRMMWFVSFGIISNQDGIYLLTDGLIKGGNSGGPWINEAGEVVAMTDWGLQSDDRLGGDVSGGISASVMIDFMEAYKTSVKTKQPAKWMFRVLQGGTVKNQGDK